MKQSRTVLITGAAVRLGKAYALSLAKAGWDIAIHCNRSIDEAHALAAVLAGLGGKAYVVQADLRKPEEVARIFPELEKQGAIPDCLINNAAVFEKEALAELAPESFHHHFDINLLAPLMLMRDFAAHYKGKEGNIINITDGFEGQSMSSAFVCYTLSKQSLAHATRMLVRELAPNIRINAIAPGWTLSGKHDQNDTKFKLKNIIPLEKVSSPDEVCDTLHYILSSPCLTGQILSLSGGLNPI